MQNKTMSINESSIWAQLHHHYRATRHIQMRDLFKSDPQRFEKMHIILNNFLVDFSKNRITEDTIQLLIQLAHEANLKRWTDDMFSGKKINISENKAVLHTALRNFDCQSLIVDNKNIIPQIQEELEKALNFAESIRNGTYKSFSGKPIKNIVNIGIGGSDLGPRMLCLALKHFNHQDINVYFVSNVDGSHIKETLELLTPDESLFIISTKSFTTEETLLNAKEAMDWFQMNCPGSHLFEHFIAVTAQEEAALNFGIKKELIFKTFDWVGGRFSVWSATGLPVMIAIGKENFLDFLRGGFEMDNHFKNEPYCKNIPVILALIGIWYNTFYKAATHAIIPYSHNLRRFPAHIQQLDMESNGKQTGKYGEYLDFDTGSVIWGEEGVNCQHAFFQLIHQGSRLIPCDFILKVNSHRETKYNHVDVLAANALAQTRALMWGKNEYEVYQELMNLNPIERDLLMPQKHFSGNQPTNTIVMKEINPYFMGILLAMYEHKIFVQGIIWGINSFDQWGVEYGKSLAQEIYPKLRDDSSLNYDSSTNGLINYFKNNKV